MDALINERKSWIGHKCCIFQNKKNCKGKIKFCRVGADTKMLESRFQNNF